jgi:Ca-activated chloride channel family protein
MKAQTTLKTTITVFTLAALLAACGVPPREANTTAGNPASTQSAANRVAVEELPVPAPMPPPRMLVPAPIALPNVSTANVATDTAMVAPNSPPFQGYAKLAYAPMAFMAAPANTERYAHFEQNPVHVAAREPVSTFSLDVDTASYANLRRFLRSGELPPEDAVRVEELVNYFPYDYPDTRGPHPFSVGTEVARAPWNPEHLLVRIAVKAQEPGTTATALPPANLVFLVDVSGSMDEPDKLPLVQASLRLLVKQLRPVDRVSLVVYAGRTAVELPATPGNQQAKILTAIGRLNAEGSTNGGAALQLAYEQARAGFIAGGINRILMATDGDFNVGVTSNNALEERIRRERDSGISLSMLAFGTGNLNDALMEQLADQGNGNYSYIDSVDEARKVLVTELGATLHTVAKDAKVQVEFNPARVAEYRLLGYENRLLREEDFRNDRVDAGEVGAGHTVTALYEVTPVGAATLHGKRRYAEPATSAASTASTASSVRATTSEQNLLANELGEVRVRYQPAPTSDHSRTSTSSNKSTAAAALEFSQPILAPAKLEAGSTDLRFAAAVAGFGELLRGGRYQGQWSYDDAAGLARGALGRDTGGWRAEFVRLVQVAESLGTRPSTADGAE